MNIDPLATQVIEFAGPATAGRETALTINHRLIDRISRLYDGPLVSSLTAFAIIALSITVSIAL